jgi:ADP-heptose:LPS heptosyltransferase
MELKGDCRYFPGDRPCRFHKEQGISCPGCQHYSPVEHKILIIKLGAMGDVLRTTALLSPLKKKFPNSAVTWVTLTPSLDLFLGNPLVQEVLDYRHDALARILTEEFDLIINPDADKLSSSLAALARGKKKLGFGLDSQGTVFCFNKEAERWLEMGAFDHIKKANRLTYQEIILDLCHLPKEEHPIVLHLLPEESAIGEKFAAEHFLPGEKKVLGLYTGAGDRWKMKSWPEKGFRELIKKILAETDMKILLYGGPDAREKNERLYAPFADSGRVVHTGVDNSLRTFFSLLNVSDLMVTGDTMALHAALALGKKVVGLFGPTSAAEIEMYGRGRKLAGTVDCLCCYRGSCEQNPTCMDTLTPEIVFSALEELFTE